MTNQHEKQCLNDATHFVAVRGRGEGRTRKDFQTMNAAKKYAYCFGDKRTMVYAVTKLGSSAHICNA